MTLILSLISGAIGGNIGAGVLRALNLGLIGNTVTGALGGALGGLLVGEVLVGTPDLAGLMATMIGSGTAGAGLVWGLGLLKAMLRRR